MGPHVCVLALYPLSHLPTPLDIYFLFTTVSWGFQTEGLLCVDSGFCFFVLCGFSVLKGSGTFICCPLVGGGVTESCLTCVSPLCSSQFHNTALWLLLHTRKAMKCSPSMGHKEWVRLSEFLARDPHTYLLGPQKIQQKVMCLAQSRCSVNMDIWGHRDNNSVISSGAKPRARHRASVCSLILLMSRQSLEITLSNKWGNQDPKRLQGWPKVT